jgi:hypothetical protein
MYCLCCWNVPNHRLYYYSQHWLYLVRRGVDLQYNHQCGLVYSMRSGLCSRNHLSVHGLYGLRQPRVYGLYRLCGGNVSKYNMYRLGQYRVYLVCSRDNIQYHHKRSLLYGLYHVCDWNLCFHGMYCLGESGVYGLCRRNLL